MDNPAQLQLDGLSLAQEWQQQEYASTFLRDKINEYRLILFVQSQKGAPVQDLVRQFSDFMDQILVLIWQKVALDQINQLTLVAVGGYGRHELHPHSDVDILILISKEKFHKADESISEFVTHLWDLGLDIGHSVRSIKQCTAEAKKDITIATNIMEARCLIGNEDALSKMKTATGPGKIWNSLDFFIAKRDEQLARHRKHNNTEYNLEPDLKEAPGGLRDVQMILWVAKRHFDSDNLHGLVEQGFLTEEEHTSLDAAQTFLWELRFALHNLCGRGENHLLFDHQRTLAKHFGYIDNEKTLAIEQLMKRYYRTAVEISELNDMLLQHFEESIVQNKVKTNIVTINERFQIRNGFIETTTEDVFELTPSALLEIFVLSAKDIGIQGIRVHTIRQIRQFRHLVNEDFRNDKRNAALFIELLNAPYSIFTQLKRMKRYGLLGNYIPEFERIIGQMQYDLFHIYTVDAHTLLLIKNLRKFRYEEQKELFPIAHNIINNLPKIAPLYIAAIFHDIGKGSGRDHSELGAELVIPFMKRHGFGDWDAELVSWMVKTHLLMSITIQRKDLADPETIAEFAHKVGSLIRLDYLYVLTVADVNATNPTIWNGWKASLFRELYTKTKQLFRKDFQQADNEILVDDRKKDAKNILFSKNFNAESIQQLWQNLDSNYFIRHNANDIAWQSEAILKHSETQEPLVIIREEENKHIASTHIFTYTEDRKNLFAATVSMLARLNLSVVDARIMSSQPEASGAAMSLNTYVVIDHNENADIHQRHEEIQQALVSGLKAPEDFPKLVKNIVEQRVSRQLKHFNIRTQVEISNTESQKFTTVEIKSLDRPGLLALIGSVFMDFGLTIHNARIATLGETVEDMFLVSDSNNEAINDQKVCDELKIAIEKKLDDLT